MPLKPSYCRDLPQGIETLAASSSEWVGRKDIEIALRVSKTVAWRLMRHCGGVLGPGNTLLCRRQSLIQKLNQLLADGGKIEYEVRRRERLVAYLENIRPQVIASRTKVVPDQDALALVNSRFASLPPNIALTAESLHIDFHGTEEFLAAIGAVIYALNNDYEAVNRFIEAKIR